MAELFSVTTDYLVKDEIETIDSTGEDKEPGIIKVFLEEATEYVNLKIGISKYISIGVILCIYSVVPLLFLLALAEGEQMILNSETASAIGLVTLLVAVSLGVSFFLRSPHPGMRFRKFDDGAFELSYGVRSVFEEKMQNYQRGRYHFQQ